MVIAEVRLPSDADALARIYLSSAAQHANEAALRRYRDVGYQPMGVLLSRAML
ncbi:hypothetical protein [Jiangella muralis]|uniref:hypothetical protein n=1 Tax=Jiangella muralis TaxID=702383 RepID=UPI0012F997CF|nr:hypothetical protein [Jiangella muralis]